MRAGYLTLETHPAHPGLVRLRGLEAAPPTPAPPPADGDAPTLRFAARFSDLDAALMHFHSGLRRALVDLDGRLYRAPLGDAVAVAEAIELPHRRVFIDPALAHDQRLANTVETLHRRHRRWDRFFNAVGIAALVLLAIRALFGI
jgi:hypothetical protein